MLICLDPGHGGKDSGAVNPDGTLEKTINLEAALTLKHFLTEQGVKVTLTRADDTYPELAERTKTANKLGCDLFVSVHHDTATSKRGGVYFKVDPKTKAPHAASKALAEKIAKGLGNDAWVRPTSYSRFGGLYIDYFKGVAVMLELGPTAPVSREERIRRCTLVIQPIVALK
jgi:N-acetylmuramoyl-L-alanine amidase